MKPAVPAKFKSGQEAVAALPLFMRVGPFDFCITKWTPAQAQGAQRFGECSPCEQEIRIQSNMTSSPKAADTFLHETLHALYWVADLGDGEKEEHVVGHLSSGLVQLYRDNPWLLTWLAQCCS